MIKNPIHENFPLYKIIPGAFFGILSAVVGVIGDILAYSLFPGYAMSKNMISELGIGPGAIFFNVGVFFSGLLAIPYVIYLGSNLLSHNQTHKTHLQVAIAGSIISSLALSFIGVFPADPNNYTIFLIHGITATICYTGAIVYLVIFGTHILKDNRFLNFFAYLAFTTAFLFGIVISSWIPLIQWIANIFIITWTVTTSLYMLYHKI